MVFRKTSSEPSKLVQSHSSKRLQDWSKYSTKLEGSNRYHTARGHRKRLISYKVDGSMTAFPCPSFKKDDREIAQKKKTKKKKKNA